MEMYEKQLRDDFVPCVKVEFLNIDGTTAFEITNDVIQDGSSLSATYQNGIRRTASLTLDNWANLYDININKIFLGQQIKISAGLYLDNGEQVFFPQGVFYITNPQEVFNPSERKQVLNLSDKYCFLDGSLFGNVAGTYKLTVNTNLFQAITALLLTDRGNGYPLDNVPPLLDGSYVGKTIAEHEVLLCPYTAKIQGSYANVLNEIATMLVANIGYNVNGQLCVDSANNDTHDNVKSVGWNFTTNEREFLGMQESPNFTETYNHVVVTGGVLNGHTAKGEAQNNDPSSPLCVQRIGKKTFSEEQSKYYSDEQCEELAKDYLRKYNRLSSAVTIRSCPMYHLQENTLVTVKREGKDSSQIPYLITGFTLPLGQTGEMEIAATRLEISAEKSFLAPSTITYPSGIIYSGVL